MARDRRPPCNSPYFTMSYDRNLCKFSFHWGLPALRMVSKHTSFWSSEGDSQHLEGLLMKSRQNVMGA